MANDSADVTSSGRLFQVCGPVTGTARLPTVDSLKERRLAHVLRTDEERLPSTVGTNRTQQSAKPDGLVVL